MNQVLGNVLSSRVFERAVDAERFRIGEVSEALLTDLSALPETWKDGLLELQRRLRGSRTKKIFEAMLRSIFLIEPVNNTITSTKFAVRWDEGGDDRFFEFGTDDPRFCEFDECMAIADQLFAELPEILADRQKVELLDDCAAFSVVAYEIPIDYSQDTVASGERIHREGNVAWAFTEQAANTLKLRAFLVSLDAPLGPAIRKALKGKVSVKTYLTDRAQTGAHQTNREKRWETHPNSVQFASRTTAWGVEHELLTQLCFFDGFPNAARQAAERAGIVAHRNDVTRCPITLDVLSFAEFMQEIEEPDWGRANFQVGHLNPLKAVGRDNPQAGHTKQNIAWVSFDGNRIQGSLSLEETRTLIERISQNYAALEG